MDLSIIILAHNEADNLRLLIPKVKSILNTLGISYEILILDGKSCDGTMEVAKQLGCKAYLQEKPGYGSAFIQAFKNASGKYVINIDADCSHDPEFIYGLWAKRNNNQLVIASRYVSGGQANMPFSRKVLSIILNKIYAFILALPYRDISSGFRLYETKAVNSVLDSIKARDFDVLSEVLIKLHCEGYNIAEIPFSYQPRRYGKSTVKLFKFGRSYFITLCYLFTLRNSHFPKIIKRRELDYLK